ncbi:phage integrase family protein [Burkholderia territorii]|nr:phage integrase family protein [Burkholderia territorii]
MPVLDTTEPGQLLDSIDVRTPIGHRDRHRHSAG